VGSGSVCSVADVDEAEGENEGDEQNWCKDDLGMLV
jgi:hypothetical protein